MGAGLVILLGTLVVGTLDLLDAIIFFGMRGVAPLRIFQSIAAGLLGRAAFQGAHRTALLGVALHYLIAFLIVLIFYLLSRSLRFLTERAILWGIVYGVAVYFTMNYVVIPMSATARGPFVLPVFINGILIHMFGVGLPAALFARTAR